MQHGKEHTECTKKIELLLLTREEDFRELSNKTAEVQKQMNKKIETLAQRVVLLEESLARSRRLARCSSK
jgi:hypothetical protein